MLRRLVPLLVLLPAIALASTPSPSDAPPSGKPAERESKLAAAQRPAPTPLPPWPEPEDGSACRLTCADHSYVCRATDHPEDCGRVWAECVAMCNSSNLDPGVPTPP